MVSSTTIITLVSLLLHRSPSRPHQGSRVKDLTRTLSQTLLRYHPGLSLANLAVHLSPSKSGLKLSMIPASSCAKIRFPPLRDVPCLLLAVLLSCKLTHDQNPQILPVAPGSDIGLLAPPASSFISCNWKYREHDGICLCS